MVLTNANMNAGVQDGPGYYHQSPPYYNKTAGGPNLHHQAMGPHQLASNEYYGKYEIEFNHHQMKGIAPVNNAPHMVEGVPFNHHPGNNLQPHGLPIKSADFVNHHQQPPQQHPAAQQQGHKMLNEFNNKAAVAHFNNQSAYYNNNGTAGNPQAIDGPEMGSHSHAYQQQQQQQPQYHHQNYHNNYDAMDPIYYHHHHHHHHHPTGNAAVAPGHHHPGGVVAGHKAANFYEANNNSINYHHEYSEMGFPNPVNATAATAGTINHHPIVPGGGGPGNNNVYVQQPQQQFGFEASQIAPHVDPQQQQQHQQINGRQCNALGFSNGE